MIKKLILHKFKRFFLTGVEHFIFTPDNVSILAWGNGMGKSSMLSQLSPLPADLKKDYNEGGYKVIELEVSGSYFILSSGYTGKGKHSFLKDNIELNPGGTRAVQLQLVEEHFKITPNIFNIMLGTELFTNMSPSTRKSWFTLLSPVDYSFCIGVWNQLRSRARDVIGSIKIFQDEQAKKVASLIDQETIEQLRGKVKQLEEVMGYLGDELEVVQVDDIQIDIGSVLKQASRVRDVLLYLEEQYGELSLEELNKKLGTIENEIKSLELELSKKNKLIQLLEKKEDGLESKKQEILDKITEYEQKVNEGYDKSKYEYLLGYYTENKEKILNLVKYLQDSGLQSLGGAKELRTVQESIVMASKDLQALEAIKMTLKGKIEEHTSTAQEHLLVCPNCKHQFYNHSKQVIDSCTKKLLEVEKLLIVKQQQLQEYIQLEKNIQNKLEAIEKLSNLVRHTSLKSYFQDLEPTGGNFYSLHNYFLVELQYLASLNTLYQDLEQIDKKIKIKQESVKLAQEAGIETMDAIEEAIEILSNKRVELFKTLKDLSSYQQAIEHYDQLITHMKSYSKFRLQSYHKGIVDTRNGLIRNIITEIKLEMSNIQKQLDDARVSDTVIKTLQHSIEEHKVKLDVLQKMVDVLSPESGLIAKSINSFLNVYLTEMNQIINSVWAYPMEILPCEVDDGTDLNYKFKVKVNHTEYIEDISKLSSSMQEIVNLAFKIVFVKYLNLTSFPLILDEFGRTMDAEHRVAAYDVIDRVLSHSFEQIILVCHFESMYSRFVNASFVELVDSSKN